MISVLYVEDESIMLEATRSHLERTGFFRVTPASSGRHALELLQASSFDVIVADYHMTGIDGIALLRQVRAVNTTIPFIIFTGKGREEVAIEAFEQGASFYVQKGGDPRSQFAELGQKIRASVEKYQAEAALEESREQFRRLTDHSPDMIFRMSVPDGMYTYVNPASVAILGYSPEEIQKKPFFIRELMPHAWRNYFKGQWDQILAGHVPPSIEYPVIHKSGELRWLNQRTVLLRTAAGSVATMEGIITDITDRRNAEEALRLSEERYRQFIHHSRDGVVLYGHETGIPVTLPWDEQAVQILEKAKVLECNEAFSRQFGFASADEMSGRPLSENMPGTREDKLALIRHFIRSGYTITDREIQDKKTDGTPFWTLNTLIGVIRDQRLVTAWATRQDITEQKAAHEALRQANIHDRSLLEASLDPLVTIGPDGKITDVNHATELATGYGREQLVGTDFSDYFTRPEQARGIYEQVFREGPVRDYPLEIRHRDGRIMNVLYHATVYRDEGGNVRGVFAAARDITERKQVADALAASEALHRSLFMACPDAMIIADSQGVITQISPRAVTLFGLTYPDEAVGTSILSWVADEDRAAGVERLKKFLTGEDPLTTIYHLKRKNGTTFIADTKTAVLHDSRGEITGLLTIVRDITDRKRAEDALHQMNRQLQLMGSITRHDILNQLMALESYVVLAREITDPSQSSLNEFIKKEGDIIKTIKTQIQFTRDYQELGVKKPVWQNLNTSVSYARSALPVRDITISVDNPSVEVLADPLFGKVIYNLIDNALRYGGSTLSCIMFSSHVNGGDLVVICEDDGVGIPDDDKEAIFERGFGNNTGLGLFLAREIVALTGMTLRETGVYGSGARFIIRVPARSFHINPSTIIDS